MYLREKRIHGRVFACVVESLREGPKVHQVIVKYLGYKVGPTTYRSSKATFRIVPMSKIGDRIECLSCWSIESGAKAVVIEKVEPPWQVCPMCAALVIPGEGPCPRCDSHIAWGVRS